MDVKLGCCNFCIPGGGTFAHEFIVKAGLDGMSVDLGYDYEGFPLMSDQLLAFYVDAGKKHQIKYSNIGCSCFDFIPLAPETSDPKHELAKKCLLAAIHAAEILEAGVIMVPMFNISTIETEDQFDRTVQMMQFACDAAAAQNIMIGAENVLPVEKQIEMVKRVDRKNFGLYYDSQNFAYNSGIDQVAVLDALYDYLVPTIHVKDGTSQSLSGAYLGEGTTNFFGVIEYLKKRSFNGWLISENYYNKYPLRDLAIDPATVFFKDMDILKNAVK
ncbi:MAG: TIM barrel protein [Eubacteriales bacterium]|nr:TIM barrel protein [Eubacteriales bacterium]